MRRPLAAMGISFSSGAPSWPWRPLYLGCYCCLHLSPLATSFSLQQQQQQQQYRRQQEQQAGAVADFFDDSCLCTGYDNTHNSHNDDITAVAIAPSATTARPVERGLGAGRRGNQGVMCTSLFVASAKSTPAFVIRTANTAPLRWSSSSAAGVSSFPKRATKGTAPCAKFCLCGRGERLGLLFRRVYRNSRIQLTVDAIVVVYIGLVGEADAMYETEIIFYSGWLVSCRSVRTVCNRRGLDTSFFRRYEIGPAWVAPI